MSRTKERRKILHEPSTHEIFRCLSEIPAYSKILLENRPDEPYANFLRGLIQVNFYNDKDEKITIKRVAGDSKIETAKASRWINEIYEEILDLNYDKPELFQGNGIKVTLHMKAYDNRCTFHTAMPVLPREFETIRFPFAHGKVGIDYFWVQKVEHEIVENTVLVTLWLEGGFLNKYREFALDKALFQGWIGSMEVHNKPSFELDDEIRKLFRN